MELIRGRTSQMKSLTQDLGSIEQGFLGVFRQYIFVLGDTNGAGRKPAISPMSLLLNLTLAC